MFTPRTRFSLQKLSDAVLVMRTNPFRRALFAALAMLLFIAFLTGFESESDLSGGRLGGTVFYALLFLICVTVALWETRFIFDRDDREVRFERRLLGFQLSGKEESLGDGAAIVVQHVQLIKESEQPDRRSLLGGRFRNYASKRNSIGKLTVETAEGRRFLDDSSNIDELEQTGQAIAEFMDIPYRKDEI